MSQRSEKYARAMAARMDKLERGLDTMGEEVKRQGRGPDRHGDRHVSQL